MSKQLIGQEFLRPDRRIQGKRDAVLSSTLSDEQVADYHRDGYMIAGSIFGRDEIELLHRSAFSDSELDKLSFGRADGEGGNWSGLSLWNHPGEQYLRGCLPAAGGL